MRSLFLSLILLLQLQALETSFTPEEQVWMKEHPVITYVGDPAWLPYEGKNAQGRYIGIVPDMLDLDSKNTPLTFKYTNTKTWNESLQKVKNGEVMMISQSRYSNRNTNLGFTQVYLRSPVVIVMQQGERYVSSLHQVRDKKIGLLDNQTTTPALKRRYPNIQFRLYPTVDKGLESVATGKIDAFLCSLPRAGYEIAMKQLTNLRIVGKSEVSTELGFGINPQYPLLLSIMNKMIADTPESDIQTTLSKWSRQKYIEKPDYTALYIALGVFAFITLISLLFYLKVRRETEARLAAQTKMLEQQSKMAAMGEMLDAVAHQWKQPLNALTMYSDLLHSDFEEGNVDKAYIDEMLEGVQVQIDHMTTTLGEFRNFFRPNSAVSTFELLQLVNSVLFLVKDEFMKNSITVDIQIDKTITLEGNENEFKHLILNIINNAKDAFNEQKIKHRHIIIESHQDSDFVRLNIQDNAGGIPENVIEHIFEANVTTKEAGKGTGIGLYMSAQIVEKMNGTIAVANVDNGASFTISLKV